jgi:hypothetical protein
MTRRDYFEHLDLDLRFVLKIHLTEVGCAVVDWIHLPQDRVFSSYDHESGPVIFIKSPELPD